MTTKRMKSNEVRVDWAEVLQHVRQGGTVIVEHYNRPIATITPYVEESAMTTTYTAAIGTHASVVEGDFCDVTVAENVRVGYHEDRDGNEIADYAMGTTVVMPAQETTVRTDEEDPWGRLANEAAEILAANGWRLTGTWELSDNAAYAPVERGVIVGDRVTVPEHSVPDDWTREGEVVEIVQNKTTEIVHIVLDDGHHQELPIDEVERA